MRITDIYLISILILTLSACSKYGDTAYLKVNNKSNCSYTVNDLIDGKIIGIVEANEKFESPINLHCTACSSRADIVQISPQNCSTTINSSESISPIFLANETTYIIF